MPGPTNGKIKKTQKIESDHLRQEIAHQKILLSIYNDIAGIHIEPDIMQRIHPRLKLLFNTSDIFICRFDKASSTIRPFLRTAGEGRRSDTDYQSVLNGHFNITDQFFSIILQSKLPVSFSIDEICKWPDPPSYAITSRNAGIHSCVSIALKYEQDLLGILTIWSEKKKGFTQKHHELLQKVADQVSIIMARIIDHEIIRQWEDDNRILLNISRELAAIREKGDLVPVLKSYLGKLPFYNDVTIARVDPGGETFSRFLVNEKSERARDKDYPDMVNAHHRFPDGVFEKALHSTRVIFFDLEDIVKTGNAPSYVQFIYRNGISHMAGISLRDRNQPIAALFLFSDRKILFSERQLHLVEGIANVLGTAVANILANEEIVRQLDEISHYKEQLEEEKLYLQEEIGETAYQDIIGKSSEMQFVFRQLTQVAAANSTVLLLGETGTGKELIARAIHHASPRKDKMLVKVNCASLPPNLVESELFGHEKGSFTGASERRIGKFELAHDGTLFLDEIGEITPELQAKLLRAIQEKEIERIGGKSPVKVNVRIIAATNRNLQKEVDEERFRKDLYYRLNVFPIMLPPLRQRKEDISDLIRYFVSRYAKNTGKHVTGLSGKAMKQAMAYDWPGNIRELEHLIERSVLTASGPVIKELHLPQVKKPAGDQPEQEEHLRTHEENEREHIIRVLNKCNGKVSGTGGAASILRLKVSTLNSKIRKLGIRINKVYR